LGWLATAAIATRTNGTIHAISVCLVRTLRIRRLRPEMKIPGITLSEKIAFWTAEA